MNALKYVFLVIILVCCVIIARDKKKVEISVFGDDFGDDFGFQSAYWGMKTDICLRNDPNDPTCHACHEE